MITQEKSNYNISKNLFIVIIMIVFLTVGVIIGLYFQKTEIPTSENIMIKTLNNSIQKLNTKSEQLEDSIIYYKNLSKKEEKNIITIQQKKKHINETTNKKIHLIDSNSIDSNLILFSRTEEFYDRFK